MRLHIGILTVAGCVVSAAPAVSGYDELAFPEILVFHGPELGRRIYLPNVEESQRFLASAEEPPVRSPLDLAERPSLGVAMFYRATWRAYARDTTDLSGLDLARADMHARFYPATGEAGALLVYTQPRVNNRLRLVDVEGLGILQERGIPTVTKP